MDKYIKWHNTIRLNDIKVKNCANIIKINFENFVQNNDGYTNILSDALSFDLVRRLGNQSFKPSESKKNIGLWKGRLAKNVADSIVAQCH